jgi:hypothetical protein
MIQNHNIFKHILYMYMLINVFMYIFIHIHASHTIINNTSCLAFKQHSNIYAYASMHIHLQTKHPISYHFYAYNIYI